MTKQFAWLPKMVEDLNTKSTKKIWLKSYYRILDNGQDGLYYRCVIPHKMNIRAMKQKEKAA